MTRFVLFIESSSVFGDYFLRVLADHDQAELAAIVVRKAGVLCDYYLDDDPVDNAVEADRFGVTVLRPTAVNTPEFIDTMRSLRPDYFIVANYQLRLGETLLDVPVCDAINFHPSPLPEYAGLAPFHWMAENHETEGGVSAVRMTAGLDEGPLIAQQLLTLRGTETAEEIRASHFEASWRLFDLVLPTLLDGSYRAWPQELSQRTSFGSPSATTPARG